MRFFVQLGSLAVGLGKVECPKLRICLIDTAYIVASQPDEFPSVVSKWIVAERSVINS